MKDPVPPWGFEPCEVCGGLGVYFGHDGQCHECTHCSNARKSREHGGETQTADRITLEEEEIKRELKRLIALGHELLRNRAPDHDEPLQ